MRASPDTVRGELRSVRSVGADFWSIVEVLTPQGPVAAVGKVVGARVGDTVELHGGWSEHARYGKQFKISSVDVVLPADNSGIVGWLCSKLPDVGRARATQLVERFGGKLWETIEHRSEELLTVDGITEQRRQRIVEAYRTHRADRDRMIGFKSWGLTDNQIARVVKELGDDAEKQLKRNPYILSKLVHGFGFKRADAVALRMGVPLDAPSRVRAALLHLLAEAASAGHVYVPSPALINITNKLLGDAVKRATIGHEYERCVDDGEFMVRRGRVYLHHLDKAEGVVAERLHVMVQYGRAA